MPATATLAPPHAYATVPTLWPDSTVAIFGGGPSLTQADVDYCRGKAFTIAIKEAGACSLPGRAPLAPWADALYACDAKYWKFEKGAPTFRGAKYALEPQPMPWPDVHVLRNAGPTGLSSDPSALCTGHNSGYQSIGLAKHLGASRIVLVGFDMWRGADGLMNWFGKHPNHVESPYPLFLHYFASIVDPLKAAGVYVVNASRQTQLQAFPRVALEEALP